MSRQRLCSAQGRRSLKCSCWSAVSVVLKGLELQLPESGWEGGPAAPAQGPSGCTWWAVAVTAMQGIWGTSVPEPPGQPLCSPTSSSLTPSQPQGAWSESLRTERLLQRVQGGWGVGSFKEAPARMDLLLWLSGYRRQQL